MISRRSLLAGAVTAGAAIHGCTDRAPWDQAAYRKRDRSRVAIVPAAAYADGDLDDALARGLALFRLPLAGRRVVLKPNLVEFDPRGVINTHPAVIRAAIEAFRRLGAREVVVAEGPGHRRDLEFLLTASGLHAILRDTGARFVDLNYDRTREVGLASRFTTLGRLSLPETVLGTDLLVSMPKLKTHHWAGVTLALKNVFGIVPGSLYGWPKNLLHWAGIQECILDINSSLTMPRFAIVDGIVGMEGNGPIQGDAKPCGVLVLGEDSVAVDATAARLMSIDPLKIGYLEQATRFLGNAELERIDQIGEPLERHRKVFRVIANFERTRSVNG
jgi:uncharacterized protein (DUF362 family)